MENLSNLAQEGAITRNRAEINTYMNIDESEKQLMRDRLAKHRMLMGRKYKQTNDSLLIKFLRFLAIKLPDKNLVFNISKGAPFPKSKAKRSQIIISVQDPFLKLENHGYWMNNEKVFQRFIYKIKELLIETSMGNLEELIVNSVVPSDDLDNIPDKSHNNYEIDSSFL